MNLIFIVYIASVCYITIPILQIVWQEKTDNDLLFLLLSNYILVFVLSILCTSNFNVFYSILASFILMLFSYFLIRKIKSIYNRYQLLSLPYFIFCVYVFSNILLLI